MLTEIQERWLQALESDQYRQCTGTMYNVGNDSYCCLGVGRKILGIIDSGNSYYLSPSEYKKLGLRSETGSLKSLILIDAKVISSLANLNDQAKWSFKKIAAYIRANPENVFVDETTD